MKYHYKSTQLAARFLTVACMLLFVSYSLVMFMRHQVHIVALSNYIGSGAVDYPVVPEYSTLWVSAILGTLLCSIPALILLWLMHFPLRFKALAVWPSYIVLGLMTGISPSSAMSLENEIPLFSFLFFIVVSALAILFSHIYHEDRGEHAPVFNYLGVNVLISCFGMMSCMFITNTDRQLHKQLALACSVHRGDYSLIDRYHLSETAMNNTVTSLRAYALSRRGELAYKLFLDPCLFGSDNLLPDTLPSARLYHVPTLVYSQLQAVPKGIHCNATAFLEKALARRMDFLSDSAATRADSLRARPLVDYYLCALLLDRNLLRFAEVLPEYYTVDENMPTHYREAMVLYYNDELDGKHLHEDRYMDSLYNDYMNLRCHNAETREHQYKACTEKYHGTYWNYYFIGSWFH
ncbi:MAG: hypothetical protein K2J00_06385 [Bacteroidaceae bacterium]|nr:hypothetical protein [Bacteroidaceae bacterium]